MARHYRRSKKNEIDAKAGCFALSFIFIVFLLFSTYQSSLRSFWLLILSIIALVLLKILMTDSIKKDKLKKEEKKRLKLFDTIRDAGLEEYINNFISRFGLGQEKDSNVWVKRNYKISYSRISDLQIYLKQRGINFSTEQLTLLLAGYIDEREFNLTINSIGANQNFFSKISWSDFEILLYRLFEKKGFSVELIGKTGDQGGDLVATKGTKRILIQAKFYKNWNVGNNSIQEAVAAKSHYDCNSACVVTTSTFTKAAVELAKTNNVILIPKEILQKMLLDHLKESWS